MGAKDELLRRKSSGSSPVPVTSTPSESLSSAKAALLKRTGGTVQAESASARATTLAPDEILGGVEKEPARFGQGAQTPLGYFGRALEAFGIAPWAGTKNARDLQGMPQAAALIGALLDLVGGDKPLLQRLAKAGTAVASTPAAAETVDQAIEFVKGNTQALPGAKDVLFSPETQERHPFMTGAAGFAAEAATNPVNWVGMGAAGKGTMRALNTATLTASGAELATQGANLAGEREVSGVNTTLAALPFLAMGANRLAPLRNLFTRLRGRDPHVSPEVQRAAIEELVANQQRKLQEVMPVLTTLEQQTAREAAQIAPGAAGRAELGKHMFTRSRAAQHAPPAPKGITAYSQITPGADAYSTYQQIAEALPELAQQAGLSQFAVRPKYFHLSSEGLQEPYLKRLIRYVTTGRQDFTPQGPPPLVGTSQHRAFMNPQTSQTVQDYERAMATRNRLPVWDPTQSMTHRLRQQFDAEGWQALVNRIKANPAAVLPEDRAPATWVSLEAKLGFDHPASRAFQGLKVEPNTAKYLFRLSERAEQPHVLAEGLDRFQNFFRDVTFFNPFDVIKRLGSQAAELGLTPGDVAKGVVGRLRNPTLRGPSNRALLNAGVLRSGVPGAERLAEDVAREAGTLPLGKRVAENIPFLPGFNRKFEGFVADSLKQAALRKLVQEGMQPEQAAIVAGQAFGNPLLMQQLLGPEGSQLARRLLFTPSWMLQNLGFQTRMLQENPYRFFALQRQLPNTFQRAVTGTEQVENPPGRQDRVAVGPPNEEGIQQFVNPSLPTKDPAQLVSNPVTFLLNRLHVAPRTAIDVGGTAVEAARQGRRLPIPPELQRTLEASRRVPAFGLGQEGYGPEVSPTTQEIIGNVVPLVPDLARSSARDTLGRDLLLELLGMFPSDLNTKGQARSLRYDVRRAVSEIRANLRRKAQQNR